MTIFAECSVGLSEENKSQVLCQMSVAVVTHVCCCIWHRLRSRNLLERFLSFELSGAFCDLTDDDLHDLRVYNYCRRWFVW